MASAMSSVWRSSTKRLLHPAHAWRAAAAARGISSTSQNCEAHNFTMPALSPTMTEGTIASWKIKEGDKFSAGDVILEVETDKAQMDVEARDDGILAKIFVEASKNPIKVGTRIGILADVDDDIASLEIPPEAPSAPAAEEPAAKAEAPKPAEPKESQAAEEAPSEDYGHGKPRKNPFVASPGLTHLLHTNGLEMSDIKGTGPGGRVLKGDVLAHLGKINKDKPKALASEIAKLAKLDLSNIKVKAPEPKKEAKPPAAEKPTKVDPLADVEVSVSISLSKVSGVEDGYIAAAIKSAHNNLPPSKIPPSTSQLFDEILGLPVKAKQPTYAVGISEIPPASSRVSATDIFDEIIGIAKPKLSVSSKASKSTVKTFKVKVPAVDQARAQAFLKRVKYLLEEDSDSLWPVAQEFR
ncbi:hypothetical protein ABW19_dt0207382 [Dactylella cylindrospora]|nr:hypothetical protein ABW19_dt0207382 [Dactylella cylindrospora]